MRSEINEPGTTVAELVEDKAIYVMDHERNPIVFKDEAEAIEYLLSCGFEEAKLESLVFIQEVKDGLR